MPRRRRRAAPPPQGRRQSIRDRMRRVALWIDRSLPPGARGFAGLLLVVGGVFGFLPVLGFWMAPLGLLVIAFDIPRLRRPARRWVFRRSERERHGARNGDGG